MHGLYFRQFTKAKRKFSGTAFEIGDIFKKYPIPDIEAVDWQTKIK